MEHSLFPTETKLKFYIERLVYGVAIAMPLQPMVGDVLLWLTVGLAIVDLIRSRSLSLPTGWLSWTVMFFVLWTGVSAALSDNAQWALTSWFYQIVASGGIYYLVRQNNGVIFFNVHWERRFSFVALVLMNIFLFLIIILRNGLMPYNFQN